MGDALRRVVRVDGDVGGAGLDDGDKSGDQVGAAGYADRDELLRAHPAGRQMAPQLVRPCVEFRVRHVLARAGQCHRIRRRGGLLLEQCHHIHGRGLDLLPVPLLQELMPLRRVDQLKAGKGLLRISRDGAERSYGTGADRFGEILLARVRTVVKAQLDARLPLEDDEMQHRVGGIRAFGPGEAEAFGLQPRGGPGDVDRVVLEDHCRVEELLVPRPALNLGQADPLVVEELVLLPLESGEVADNVLVGGGPGVDGHRVDEQAHHALHARQFGRAAGDGRAEGDVGAVERVGEGEGPGTLKDGVQGEVVAAGPAGELVGCLLVQVEGETFRRSRDGARLGGDEGGPVQGAERGRPGIARGLVVALGEPGQVVAVRHHPGEAGVGAGHVQRQQFADHDRQ